MGSMYWRWLMWVVGSFALLLPAVAGAAVLSREVPLGEAYGVPGMMAAYPTAAGAADQVLVVYAAQDLRASRVASDGTVLDVPGLVLGDGLRGTIDAQVVSDGTNYLVTWMDTSEEGVELWGQIVYASGSLDSPFKVSVFDSQPSWDFAVGYNGKNYIVVSLDWNGAVYAANVHLFTRHGRRVGRQRTAFVAEFVGEVGIAASTDGTLLLWDGGNGVEGLRLDSKGRPRDGRPLQISSVVGAQAISVSSDGGGYYAVIGGTNVDSDVYGVFGVAINMDGTVSRDSELLSSGAIEPQVVRQESGYWATWVDYDDDWRSQLIGLPVNRQGVPDYGSKGALAPEEMEVTDPTIVPLGSEWLAVYNSSLVAYANKFARPGDHDAEAHPVSLVENSQRYPDVVWDGGQFVTAWLDSSWEPIDAISFTRMGKHGRKFDKRPIAVETPTPTSTISLHSLGSDPILVNRSDPSGAFVAPFSVRDGYGPELALTGQRSYLEVVSGADLYLGLRKTYDADWAMTAGELVTFDSYGTLEDLRSLTLPSGGEFWSVFPVGDKLAVTTIQDERQDDPTWVYEVSGSGAPSTPRRLRDRAALYVNSATDGLVQFLLGMDYYGGALWAGVWSDGQWLAEPVTVAYDAYIHKVAWDGTKFWLLWSQYLAATIQAQAFSPSGEALEQIDLGITGVDELQLASDGEGHIALAYLKYTEDWESNRAYARVLDTTK